MRQGQQNRRGRGRNRKSQNPLTRSFESNGPDVKIRGTPAHIAEKYISLARDAQSSGDPVLAESYLQHAEHYNRIIMAYREQQVQQGGGDPAQMRRQPGLSDFADGDDVGDEGDDDMAAADVGGHMMGHNEPQPSIRSFEPQQRQDRQDRQDGGRGRGEFQGRQGGRDRQGGGRGNDRRQGGEGDQPRREPREARDNRDNRGDQDRQEQGSRRGGGSNGSGEGRRRDFAGGDQPEFLRRSVRRPRRARDDDTGEGAAETAAAEDSAE